MRYHQPILTIYLYDEPDAAGLDITQVGGFVASMLPRVEVVPRSDFFTYQFARFTPEQRAQLEKETVRQLGSAQVHDLTPSDAASVLGPLAPEERGLDIVFQAALYQSILRLLISADESRSDSLHIHFTSHAIGSWSRPGERFRLHVTCMGAPSIISIPGLVEALPRPREYDFKRAQFAMLGLGEEALDDLAEEFADRTFGYGDPRINQLCSGYALMACVYRMTGEAFCTDPDCRLHPARDQEDLIYRQCGEGSGLCDRHSTLLRSEPPQ